MSDRFFTYIKISGPNANAAAKSAATLLSTNDAWCDGDDRFPQTFFSKDDSGEEVIDLVLSFSKQFPEAVFHLLVDGSCDEGLQGPVMAKDGTIIADGRCKEISSGEEYDTPTFIELMKPFDGLPPKDAVEVKLSAEQLAERDARRALLDTLWPTSKTDISVDDNSMADVLGSPSGL